MNLSEIVISIQDLRTPRSVRKGLQAPARRACVSTAWRDEMVLECLFKGWPLPGHIVAKGRFQRGSDVTILGGWDVYSAIARPQHLYCLERQELTGRWSDTTIFVSTLIHSEHIGQWVAQVSRVLPRVLPPEYIEHACETASRLCNRAISYTLVECDDDEAEKIARKFSSLRLWPREHVPLRAKP